jgi:hypothetical protein
MAENNRARCFEQRYRGLTKKVSRHARGLAGFRSFSVGRKETKMKLREKIQERAAAGYILLWLLGVPIPVLLLFFLLRGCT